MKSSGINSIRGRISREKLGKDREAWSKRVYVYAGKQNELLDSPMTSSDVHDIAWSVASARWAADHGVV